MTPEITEAVEIAIGSGIWGTIWLAWWMFNRWFWKVKEPVDHGMADPQ